jgi:N-acetyl-alpha-D-glucosaminyl L-malate synthase BshA
MAAACRIAEVPLDVLHVHYAYPHAVSAYLAKEMSGGKLPTITTLHGTDIHLVGQDASFARVTRFGLERSDAVSAVSAFLRDKTRAWFGIERPIEVIPNFVDTSRFEPGRPLGPVLLHISNFRPVKRAADAVRAFYLLRRRREARLVMLGSGPEQGAVRNLAERLGILPDVEFAGEEPDVVPRLRGAALLLSTSEFEGFGMAALEAMACGVPVVATRSGGVSEVTGEGGAHFVDVGDVEAMAEAAARILGDGAQARAMGEAGRRRAKERFDTSVVVPQYEGLYERVCGIQRTRCLG